MRGGGPGGTRLFVLLVLVGSFLRFWGVRQAGSGGDPWGDDFVGGGQFGVKAAAGFERVQSADVAAFELAEGALEGFEFVQGVRQKAQVVEISCAVEGHLGDEIVFDRVGGAVVIAVGIVDLDVVVL